MFEHKLLRRSIYIATLISKHTGIVLSNSFQIIFTTKTPKHTKNNDFVTQSTQIVNASY